MPLYGSLDLTAVAQTLPTLPNLDTESWALPKAEMMQLLIEVPRSSTDGLLPKAMHPALPSYVILAVTKYPDSPVGPFTLAVLRLGSRAGAHPHGFLLGAVASTDAAAKELRARWGFPVEAGEVKFLRRHDRGRGMGVVEQGRVAGKAFLPHQLLGVEAAVGLAELGVALRRYLAEPAVVRHLIIVRNCPRVGGSTRFSDRVELRGADAPAGAGSRRGCVSAGQPAARSGPDRAPGAPRRVVRRPGRSAAGTGG